MPKANVSRRSTSPGSGLASRYRALLLTHGSLEEKLQLEMSRPQPDGALVRRMKRRKLSLKDEMASIERLFEAVEFPRNGDLESFGAYTGIPRRRTTRGRPSKDTLRQASSGI